MLYKDLRMILETRIAPKKFKMTNEYYGLQYGEINDNKQIKRILITLDANLEVIHYSIKCKVDLIISHHGFLIKPISYINKNLINKLNLLSNYPIKIYILNSSFIAAEEGISKTISDVLYLKIDNIFKIRNKEKKAIPIGRISLPLYLPNDNQEITLETLLKRIKSNFNMNNISYVGNLKRKINKICIVGGDTNNINYIEKILKNKCDCYISSNINHKIAMYAKEVGICLINISHHNAELYALKKLYNFLSLEFPYDEFLFFDSQDPFRNYI